MVIEVVYKSGRRERSATDLPIVLTEWCDNAEHTGDPITVMMVVPTPGRVLSLDTGHWPGGGCAA